MSDRIWTRRTSTDSDPRSSERWPAPPGRSRPGPWPRRSSPPGPAPRCRWRPRGRPAASRRTPGTWIWRSALTATRRQSTRVLRMARSSGSTSSATLRTFSLVLALERRRGDHRQPLVGRALQLPQRRLGGARRREHLAPRAGRRRPGCTGPRRAAACAMVRDDDRGLAPWPPQRSRRDDRGGEQRDGTPDHRVEPPRQRIAPESRRTPRRRSTAPPPASRADRRRRGTARRTWRRGR